MNDVITYLICGVFILLAYITGVAISGIIKIFSLIA